MKTKLTGVLLAAGIALAILGSAEAAKNPGGAHKDGSGGGPSPSHWAPGR